MKKSFYDLENVHGCNNGISIFMGKNYQNNCHCIVNTTDLTLKQMFDISTKFASEQDKVSGMETISWENHSWRYLSLIGDEWIINLQRTKVYVFSESVLCFGMILGNPESNEAWEQRLGWIKSSQNYRILTESMVSQWKSSGIFPKIQYVAAQRRSQKIIVQIGRNTGNFYKKNSIKKNESFSKRCNARHWRTFFHLLNV